MNILDGIMKQKKEVLKQIQQMKRLGLIKPDVADKLTKQVEDADNETKKTN